MKRNTNGTPRPQRSNVAGMLLTIASLTGAAYLNPSLAVAQNTAPPTAATAAQTAAAIRGQLNDLGQRLSIAPCRPDQWRIGVRMPVPGGAPGQTVEIPACVTSDHPPCGPELEGARNALIISQHTFEVRQRIAIAMFMRYRQATDARLLRIEQVNDRQDGDLAALEVINAQLMAYLQQLGGPWADSVVEALNNLNAWVTSFNAQLAQLRTDLTAETTRATTAENTERTERTATDLRHDNELAAARRRRLTLGISVGGLYLDGPGRAPSLGLVVGGLDVIGRPIASTPSVVLTAAFYAGYGETTNGSRGGFASSIYAGPGYEWANTGRILLQAGYTRVESSRWRETSMLTVGGVRLRGEFDLSSVFTIYAAAGWEWGNAIDVANGAPVDASRFNVGGGLSARLGNW